MRNKKTLHFTILHLLLWVGLLQPDGFAEHTLVRYEHGFKPIQNFVVGNHAVIVAEGGQLQPYSITRTMSYVANYFIKLQIKDICVCVAPDQKFYSCTRNDWVSARALETSEQLLCGSGNIVCVDAIEAVHKQQKMHTFTVDTSHIFCVTPYEIIAHNIDPVSTAGTAILSVACPPAGIVAAIGQIAAFGVLGCVMFCKHRKAHKYDLQHKGCFCPENRNSSTMPITSGCYQPVQNVPLVCDIKAGKLDLRTKLVHETPEKTINIGCEFPIHAEKPELYNAAITQNDGTENKRYDGPWYNRTEDWIKEHPFGQKIKDCLERTDHTNQGKRVYRIINKIEDCDGFNKGDFVVIDALHNDHLEVFNKRGKWIRVANFDGTINHDKTVQGEKDSRVPLG